MARKVEVKVLVGVQDLGRAPDTECCDVCASDARVYTLPGLDGYFNACPLHVEKRAKDVVEMVGLHL